MKIVSRINYVLTPYHPILPYSGQLDKIVHSMTAADEARIRIKFATLYLTGLLPGLHSLHSNGIVHLDLKPENAMNSSDCPGMVTILDFGLFMQVHQEGYPSETSTGGTPWYTDLERLCCPSCPASPSADM